MNRLNAYGVATALSFWAAYAVAEDPQVPSPDLSLIDYAKPQRNYGAIPIRVLSASEPLPDTPADALAAPPPFLAEKLRAHGAIAALSTDGINKMVQASHEIQNLKPEVVISNVGEVIDKARTNLRTGVTQH